MVKSLINIKLSLIYLKLTYQSICFWWKFFKFIFSIHKNQFINQNSIPFEVVNVCKLDLTWTCGIIIQQSEIKIFLVSISEFFHFSLTQVTATSMLVTDVGNEMCWWQLWDVGDAFDRFRHQHPLSFNISVGHEHPKIVTNIEILSLASKNCHQDKVTNIDLSPTSM